jgi:DNA-binding response OmpR family regulator
MKKILIVEDELDLAKVVRKRIAEEGYEVIVANDTYQAIKYAHEHKPDLIILDLMLPGGGGMFFLQNLRMTASLGHLPVVVLTGMKNDTYKTQILREGVEAYLEKPYEPAELIGTIRRILEGKSSRGDGELNRDTPQ